MPMYRPHRIESFLLLAVATCALIPTASGTFVDVAVAAGLTLSPAPLPETDPPAGINRLVTGSPICAADLDRDGWTDLLLCSNPGRLQVFINNRDGTFREEGIARGFGEAFDISGIAAGDFSNSGRTDVFLVPRIGPRYFLYVNDGNGFFTEQAIERGADVTVSGEPHKGQSIGLVDFDRDGFLDIHVTEWGVPATSGSATHAVLLRNRGHEKPGHFVNFTATSGLTQPVFGTTIHGFISAWADFDEDGYPDLSLINDFGKSQLWWNNGDGTFTEGRLAAGVGTDGNGMGMAVGDIDRDGRLDFFVSSFDRLPDGVLLSANRLYRNRGDRTFQDVAPEYGVLDSGWGWGSAFLDANNDQLLDLIVTNGYIHIASPSQNPPPNQIVDARTDRTRFFLNQGGFMTETGETWGVTDTELGRSVAILDFDNDGDEDVVIANGVSLTGTLRPWILYRNDNPNPSNHWLRLRFRGTVSNRDGYGTVVRLTAGGATQTALYAPTNAYIGQREPVLHFGLGAAATVTSLTVQWPSGAIREMTGLAANQVLTLIEPEETTNQAPEWVAQPVGGAFEKNASITLTASADGIPGPLFQWLKDGVPLPGANSPDLHLPRLHPSDAGSYTVVATNAAGSIQSRPADLGVTADPERHTVARWWNETLLDAIRRDTPNPPVHARNLYHLSAALWDAFWPYQPEGWSAASPAFHREDPNPWVFESDPPAAQRVAMSHAAYTILSARFARSPGAGPTSEGIRWTMDLLGCDPDNLETRGNSPPAVGNRIGRAILAATLDDGANESNDYADATGYVPVNPPLVVGLAGTAMTDPNRWQPLSLAFSITQNGIVLPDGLQEFIGVNARLTTPFALGKSTDGSLLLDPGPPPLLGGAQSGELVAQVVEVIRLSSMLDPRDGVEIDISPGATLNNPLGTNDGGGHSRNPVTGEPYAPNPVLRADYGRILAEFWADGPDSETPPGHWNLFFNQISDHPSNGLNYAGSGEVLSRLEWEVRGYLALNGALHDAACAAWTVKRNTDSARPISLIRHLSGLGQSSDPSGPAYHSGGLPLIPDLIELTTAESLAPGGRHAGIVEGRDPVDGYIGKIAVRSWLGSPGEPSNRIGGVGWVLGTRWIPYQKNSFVTPAFPGYVSGHSTFSRTGAEVLTLLTGSPWFPGGIEQHTFERDVALGFEQGPARDLTLEWATYQDAADEAGISRIYGGIHIAADDLAGRRLGARIGLDAFLKAHAMRSAGRDRDRLVNVSTRGVSGSGERVLIAGLVTTGGESQQVLVRAVGPGLSAFGMDPEGLAPDPSLSVFQTGSGSEPLLENDDWSLGSRPLAVAEAGRSSGAFALESGSPDAAELLETPDGVFTILARSGAGDELPVQLVEAYGRHFANISTRGFVGTTDRTLIAGFSVIGSEPVALLVRGVGPSLAALGVSSALEDPVIQINRIQAGQPSLPIAFNDNWSDDERASLAEVAANRVAAFPLKPGTRDAAVFLQLPPGIYTVRLSGKDGEEGLGLVEVYHVD